MPRPGMDQLNFIEHARALLDGIWPDQSYKLSPVYTVFLALLSFVSGDNLLIMRILQVVLCSLIPVFIFKLARRLGCNFFSSQAAAFIYCFYGPAVLISISMLRAAPLALCFIVCVFLLVRAFYSLRWYHYLGAGIFAGITVLGRENFIPVIFAPYIMFIFPLVRTRINWKMALLYFAGIAVLIVPVIGYNYFKFGAPEIIPGNFAHIFNFYHGTESMTSSAKLADSIVERIPSQVKMFAASYELPNSLSFYAHQEIIPLLMFLCIPFNLILGVAIAALLLNVKRTGTIFVAGMAAGYFLTIIYFTLFYRFRIPDVPLLCVLCAVFIDTILRAKTAGRKYAVTAVGILIAVFVLLSYTAPNKLRTESERRATVMVLINCEEYSRAEGYMDELVADGIPLNNLDKYLITSLHNANLKDEAQRIFEKYILKKTPN